MITVFWMLFGALIGTSAAQRRGFSTVGGVLGGALLGPLAVLLYKVTSIAGERTKRCPFCAEAIQADAVVCKHCRRDVAFTLMTK